MKPEMPQSDSCSSSPLSSLQGASDIKDHHELKFSPQPSYHFNFLYSSTCLKPIVSNVMESKKGPCLKPIVSNSSPTAKTCAELIMEITTVEAEIVHLESYLLSLYRTAFEQYLPAIFENCGIHLQCEIGSKKLSQSQDMKRAVVDSYDIAPHRLSEDIVRCISSIYCKLSHPTTHTAISSSNMFFPRNLSDTGPYAAMIQVLQISLVDDVSFNYATTMLQKFGLLVRRLEKVDPGKMAREEKLSFWINIHNALVMHAHLAYGTHTCVKGTSIAKATYNVGGHCIDAYVVQNSILGIRSHHSTPWLQTLLYPGKKFKLRNARHAYAVEYPEPLVHFALCSGSFSDPAVRVYTAENVFQNLKIAREEYIQGSVYIRKEGRKVYLPKILYYFAKDTSLNVHRLLDMVGACLSAIDQKEAVGRCMSKDRPDKYICWFPQSSTFRYVFHGDVVANANAAGIPYVDCDHY